MRAYDNCIYATETFVLASERSGMQIIKIMKSVHERLNNGSVMISLYLPAQHQPA